MTNESLQAQLADAELDRLEELLSDDALPNAMRLDEIQGYLCAALTGPQPIPEEEWLADALGDETLLETWRTWICEYQTGHRTVVQRLFLSQWPGAWD